MKTSFSPAAPAPTRADGARSWRWLAPLNPPLSAWKGRRVWIVGASSGIGLATAQALLSQGAHLVVSARNQAALTDFADRHAASAAAAGGSVQPIALDVTDAGCIAAAARAAVGSLSG